MGKFYDTKIALRTSELAEQNKWMAKDANAIDIWATNAEARLSGLETGTSNQIIVSAIWISGFSFDCTADSFPINDIYYSAPDNTVTHDSPSTTSGIDRIDYIAVKKAIAPATQGIIEIIKGDEANEDVVAPPDYDPSEYYIIKQVLLKANATVPSDPITGIDFSQNLVFSENVGEPTEWTASTFNGSIDFDSVISHSGSKSAFYDTSGIYSRGLYTNDVTINTEDISEVTFWYKQNESSVNKFFFLKFYNGTTLVKTVLYKLGSDSTSGTSLDWQKIIIDSEKLALPNTTIDSFQLYLFKNTGTGYYIDDLIVNSGSSVQPPIANNIPTLQEVTDEGNTTSNDVTLAGDTFIQNYLKVGDITDSLVIDTTSGILYNPVYSTGKSIVEIIKIISENINIGNTSSSIGIADSLSLSSDNSVQVFSDSTLIQSKVDDFIVLESPKGIYLKPYAGGFGTNIDISNLTALRNTFICDIDGIILTLSDSTTVPTPTNTGKKGEVRIIGSFRYECKSDDVWVRMAIDTTW